METVQQNGRYTFFSSKFPSNIYSILFVFILQSSLLQGTGVLGGNAWYCGDLQGWGGWGTGGY